ncbi:MAG TPA: hypothetical protein VJ647_05520 [Chitinophagaceae bacterium]|nr:hypothetical protein [Chitinophagaceae bacterium]
MTQKQIDNLSIKERLKSPTPKLFHTLKVIGLTLAAASGALLAAPVALPAIVTTIAGYIATAGLVATAVSQVTVEG